MRNYEAVYGEAAGRRPKKYYYILDNDTFQLVLLPTKYLKYKVDVERSPNTVKRFALSLSYCLQYLSETELELAEVSRLGFEEQSKHFVQFLYWLKEGRHVDTKRIGNTRNATCNAYLRDVFGFFYIWQTTNIANRCGFFPMTRSRFRTLSASSGRSDPTPSRDT